MMALSSMAGLCASSQSLLSGNLQIRRGFKGLAYSPELRSPVIRAQQMQKPESEVSVKNRRAVIGLLATGLSAGLFIDNVLANGIPIKIGPPPPPSGGLAGTRNSDEARDLDLPLKERFYLQPLSPSLAAERAKESAKDIVKVKELIDRKAWPYVMNDLRTKANYLRFDLKTVISAKPKEEKKELKDLTSKLFASIDGLDHAAKTKSSSQADKYYSDTVAVLNDVLAKI